MTTLNFTYDIDGMFPHGSGPPSKKLISLLIVKSSSSCKAVSEESSDSVAQDKLDREELAAID